MQSISAFRSFEQLDAAALRERMGEVVALSGCVHKIRRMRGFSFVILRMSRDLVQCVAGEDIEGLKEGVFVRVIGLVAPDGRSKLGYEVRVQSYQAQTCPPEAPPVAVNGKKLDLPLETLLHHRPLTLRSERERAIFKLQEGVCRGFCGYLSGQGFTKIHTPKLIRAGAEGGANQFALDYFGKQAYLAQSPQCYKQIMVGAFERVFEIGPVFRAEKHDTNRHLNEYISLDAEMGFIESFADIMALEAAMIRAIFTLLGREYGRELAALKTSLPEVKSIPALRFDEAQRLAAGESLGAEQLDLSPEQERRICARIKEETGSDFVFVTHYPSKKRPFYAMDDPSDPESTLSFDLLYRGMEVTTGGQRIHDYKMQVEKMRARGMDPSDFEDYLSAHRYGLPPHGGFGLGLERFTARMLGLENIRYASLFPRDSLRLRP